MSNADLGVSVNGTPSIPTTFTADSGSAVPAANVLIVSANDTNVNNDNGIRTIAGAGQGLSANEVQVQITNRLQTGATVEGAGTANVTLADFSASPFSGTAGIYVFQFRVAAFDSATPSGAIYSLDGGIRTDGTTPVLIGDFDKIVHEEAALSTGDANVVVSGNELVLQITGVAGLTVAWDVVGLYTRSV